MSALRQFGDVATNPKEAYLPYLAAVEAGRLDPETAPDLSPQDAALMLRNGVMPGGGAVVDLGGGQRGAYDVVAVVHLSDKEAVVAPAPKDNIDDETGLVKRPGGLSLSLEAGRLRLPALYDRPELADWRPETYRRVGDTAVKWLKDAPFFDILAIDEGFYIARRPMRIL